jgi:hypothetical protein
VSCWSIGSTEEGRDTRACAVADEATIKDSREVQEDHGRPHRSAQDERRDGEAADRDGKPIYWATGSIHSGETGSVEMLMELGYRLAIERVAVHPADPQQPHLRLHADDGGRRTRRQVDNQRARARTSRSRRWSTGASTSRTTTTATASARA